MKQIKLLATLAVALVLLNSSCKSGEEKKTEAVKDTTVTQPAPPPPPAPVKPGNQLVIRHKVANFAKWKVAFEGHDSARLANGLHKYILGRDVEDTNMVTISLIMDDTAKAKAFGASANLKEVMKKAGVISAPTIQMMDVQWMDTSAKVGPLRMKVAHKVKDYAAWKKVFDEDRSARTAAGLTDRVIERDMNDPNMVVLVFAVSDIAKAKAMLGSKELKDKMQSAGVEGKPTAVFFNIVEKY
jgi:hypothetical protein